VSYLKLWSDWDLKHHRAFYYMYVIASILSVTIVTRHYDYECQVDHND